MSTQKIFGKLVTPDGIHLGTVTVTKGKITAIDLSRKAPAEAINYKDHYILPGLIEVHGHMREPGLDHKEDVPHGTRAALAGGVTTIIDMPNTKPPTTTIKLLQEKIDTIYPGRSYTDYAFFMGAGSDSLAELKKVDRSSIAGIKVFMAGHETTPTTIPDDETLAKVFKIASDRDIILAVHAEDQYLINTYGQIMKDTGGSDPELWSQIRPKDVIVIAVKRALALAQRFKTRLYLLHLSTPEEFTLVHEAAEKGLTVYGELVGYQLIFTTHDYKRLGNKIKVAPALRDKDNQKKLWELVRGKKVDVICSEHTPHELATKHQLDVWKAQSGTPAIQETLPSLITAWVKRYGIETLDECISTIVSYSATHPAKIFNFPSKGTLEVGKDADLVVIDTQNKWKVMKKDLFSKCGWSAYEGMDLLGRPIATYLRGQNVYKDGQIVGDAAGEWIHKKKK